jgi:hypothetical protein
MHSHNETEPRTNGTLAGATLSLLLIVAFGLSSIFAEQKAMDQNASEVKNQATVVRAYLA